jgi:hypothetical protein
MVECLLRPRCPDGHRGAGQREPLRCRQGLWLHAELPAENLSAGDLQAGLPHQVHLSTSSRLLQADVQPRLPAFLLPPGLSLCDSRTDDRLCSESAALRSASPPLCPGLCGSRELRSRGLWPGGVRSFAWPGLHRSGGLRSDRSRLCGSDELRSGLRSFGWSRLCRSRGLRSGDGCELRRSRELCRSSELLGSGKLCHGMCEDLQAQVLQCGSV